MRGRGQGSESDGAIVRSRFFGSTVESEGPVASHAPGPRPVLSYGLWSSASEALCRAMPLPSQLPDSLLQPGFRGGCLASLTRLRPRPP